MGLVAAGQVRSGAQAGRQPSQKGQGSEEPNKSKSVNPSAANRQPASQQKEGRHRRRFMRWPLSGLAEKALLRAGVDEDVSRQGVLHTCPQCKQAPLPHAACSRRANLPLVVRPGRGHCHMLLSPDSVLCRFAGRTVSVVVMSLLASSALGTMGVDTKPIVAGVRRQCCPLLAPAQPPCAENTLPIQVLESLASPSALHSRMLHRTTSAVCCLW